MVCNLIAIKNVLHAHSFVSYIVSLKSRSLISTKPKPISLNLSIFMEKLYHINWWWWSIVFISLSHSLSGIFNSFVHILLICTLENGQWKIFYKAEWTVALSLSSFILSITAQNYRIFRLKYKWSEKWMQRKYGIILKLDRCNVMMVGLQLK